MKHLKNNFNFSLLFFLLLILFFSNFSFVSGKDYFSQIAVYFQVADNDAQSGDIVVKKNGQLLISKERYDNDIFGVIAIDPIITFGEYEENSLPIVTSGIAIVKVNGNFEKIKTGDYITSSEIPGVGQKAVTSGFVVGRSLENFEGDRGLIKIMVDPHEAYFEKEISWEKITFWEALGRIMAALERDVPNILRFVFAFFLAGGSFLIGFRSFARSLREGISGISRNPLAKNSIHLSMLMTLGGILILTLAGLGLALFIILL